jgi:hypothetical protein
MWPGHDGELIAAEYVCDVSDNITDFSLSPLLNFISKFRQLLVLEVSLSPYQQELQLCQLKKHYTGALIEQST